MRIQFRGFPEKKQFCWRLNLLKFRINAVTRKQQHSLTL